jgi:hypothetical protein
MLKPDQSGFVEAGLQPGSSPITTKPVFSTQTLVRLWPNREHESSWLKSLACRFGLHRWQNMQFGSSPSAQVAQFCRWCSKIKTLQGPPSEADRLFH